MSALHQIRQSSTERRCTCQHAQGFEGDFITQSFSGQLVVQTPTYLAAGFTVIFYTENVRP